MTVLVTGGGGFLARYIVEQLLARGDTVRSFARGDYPELTAIGVECVRGDLRNADDVQAACKDIDTVFHVASLAAIWGKYQTFYDINVTGTENIIAGCRANGIGKLVYTSTPSVVFPMGDLEGVDESQPYPDKYLAHYPATKMLAEKAVLQANDESLATCALRPHIIWGPRDNHIIPLLTERAKTGKLVRVGEGKNLVDLTYVENGAQAHLQAADHLAPGSAVAGKAYFISDGKPANMWNWIDDLLTRLGLPLPTKHISASTAVRLGGIMECIYKLFPFLGEPRLTRFIASNFATSHYFDITRAREDFGYDPQVDNEEGLRRTIAWYQSRK